MCLYLHITPPKDTFLIFFQQVEPRLNLTIVLKRFVQSSQNFGMKIAQAIQYLFATIFVKKVLSYK